MAVQATVCLKHIEVHGSVRMGGYGVSRGALADVGAASPVCLARARKTNSSAARGCHRLVGACVSLRCLACTSSKPTGRQAALGSSMSSSGVQVVTEEDMMHMTQGDAMEDGMGRPRRLD